MKTKAEAIKAGRKLIQRLKGKGWKLHVWENLGWHYSASLGNLAVYPTFYNRPKPKYHALLSNGGFNGTGEMYWTDNFHSVDPNKVVSRQMKAARQFLEQCNATIETIDKKLRS